LRSADVDPKESQLIATLENAPAWVDKLSWSPTSNQLAFCLGRHVQVWDADAGEVAATLNRWGSKWRIADFVKDIAGSGIRWPMTIIG
jgi:hypothetical protein